MRIGRGGHGLLGIGRAVQRGIDVHMLFQRQCRVEHGFDLVLPMALQRRLDAVGPGRALLEDMAARHGAKAHKQLVAAGKVGMAQHMRGDQGIFGQRIVFRHVGVAGVAGEHDFEDMRVAHLLMHELVDVAHAKRPVAHAHGQAIDGDLGHEAVGHQLEVDAVEFQAQRPGQLLDARPVVGQGGRIGGAWRAHAPSLASSASCWKKVRMAAQTSSGVARMLLRSGKPRLCCSAHSRCISVSMLRGTPGTVST